MTTERPLEEFKIIVSAAEEVLSDTHGPIRIVDVERISEEERRNLLLRIRLDTPPKDGPETLIIKRVVADEYNPDDVASWHTQRFFNDWVGAQFLSSLPGDPGHGPRFYGGHRALGFIILEDMGREHRSLVEPLLGGDAAETEAVLLQFTQRLGQMHSDTLGQAHEHRQLLRALHPGIEVAPHGSDHHQIQAEPFIEKLRTLNVTPEEGCAADLDTLAASLRDPGPFTAYIHGDPCPDNFFLQERELRIMDFEFGRMGHALLDIAYGRMIFPTCWCCNRVPSHIVTRMEATYREVLAHNCPAAQDDAQFYQALTYVCGYWLCNTLNWMLEEAVKKDHTWGITTVRPRILARLEAFIETSNEFKQLPALRGTANRLLDELRTRWSDVEPLPLYPAFRNESPL